MATAWSGEQLAQIATADMNNDGNLDIVEAGGGTGVGITVLLGSSHGAFGVPISTAVGCGQANRGGVNAIALGNVTGDGKVDVVATGGDHRRRRMSGTTALAVLPGQRQWKIQKTGLLFHRDDATVLSSAGLGDFNGDGKLDIVLSNGDGSLSILLNKGKGVYGAANVIAGASGTEAGNIVIGDFNHDGKLDVAVTNYSGTAINVLLGNGDGTFQAPIITPSPINPSALVGGDFNEDGKLDLALTSWNNTGSLTIFTGNGNGTFNVGTTYAFNTWDQCQFGGTNPFWMSAADLNQDGKLDLAIAVQYSACDTQYNGQNTWGAAVVYTGNGDGTFNLDLAPGSPRAVGRRCGQLRHRLGRLQRRRHDRHGRGGQRGMDGPGLGHHHAEQHAAGECLAARHNLCGGGGGQHQQSANRGIHERRKRVAHDRQSGARGNGLRRLHPEERVREQLVVRRQLHPDGHFQTHSQRHADGDGGDHRWRGDTNRLADRHRQIARSDGDR